MRLQLPPRKKKYRLVFQYKQRRRGERRRHCCQTLRQIASSAALRIASAAVGRRRSRSAARRLGPRDRGGRSCQMSTSSSARRDNAGSRYGSDARSYKKHGFPVASRIDHLDGCRLSINGGVTPSRSRLRSDSSNRRGTRSRTRRCEDAHYAHDEQHGGA